MQNADTAAVTTAVHTDEMQGLLAFIVEFFFPQSVVTSAEPTLVRPLGPIGRAIHPVVALFDLR